MVDRAAILNLTLTCYYFETLLWSYHVNKVPEGLVPPPLGICGNMAVRAVTLTSYCFEI